MEIAEKPFKTTLITRGRKTGNDHSVVLLAVKYNEKIYFSRHMPDSDWFANAVSHPKVRIQYQEHMLSGNAKLVTDEKLNKKISELKYLGQARAKEHRVAIEVTLE